MKLDVVTVVDAREAGSSRGLDVLARAVLLVEVALDESLHTVEAAVEDLHRRAEREADKVVARRLKQVALCVSFRQRRH